MGQPRRHHTDTYLVFIIVLVLVIVVILVIVIRRLHLRLSKKMNIMNRSQMTRTLSWEAIVLRMHLLLLVIFLLWVGTGFLLLGLLVKFFSFLALKVVLAPGLFLLLYLLSVALTVGSFFFLSRGSFLLLCSLPVAVGTFLLFALPVTFLMLGTFFLFALPVAFLTLSTFFLFALPVTFLMLGTFFLFTLPVAFLTLGTFFLFALLVAFLMLDTFLFLSFSFLALVSLLGGGFL